MQKKKKSTAFKFVQNETNSESSGGEESISLKILQQLKRMNTRLDAVEEQVATVKGDSHQRQQKQIEQSKLKVQSVVLILSKNLFLCN